MNTRIEAWSKRVEPGHWPDADMLPLGHIGLRAERGNDRLSQLTHDEQRTLLTLWSIARSPLMFGGDLPTLDPFTTTLLTNGAVLSANQHSTGNHIAYSKGDLRVWTAHATGANHRKYIAAFNLGDTPVDTHLRWQQIGWKGAAGAIEELWTNKKVPGSAGLNIQLAPHASSIYSVSAP